MNNMKRFFNTLLVILSILATLVIVWQNHVRFPTDKVAEEISKKGLHEHDTKTWPGQKTKQIPEYVIKVLDHIRAYDKAPVGYVGGRTFFNREKLLPVTDSKDNKIYYREWDVRPKVQGKSRGPERLVTGSDGKAYYTVDHYQRFLIIQ